MRSSKYHDYRVLKIALFILVVLALFVYLKFIEAPHEHTPAGSWEVVEKAECTENGSKIKVCTECNAIVDTETIPATGHNPGMAVRENEKAATCSMGGSYDVVVYCRNCNIELSRETVQVEKLDHKPATAVKKVTLEATHVNAGSYDMITKCKDCGDVLETKTNVIPALGHSYTTWELDYVEEIDEFVLVGMCSCNETGNKIYRTVEDGVRVVLDDSNPSCIEKKYIITYVFNGQNIEKTYIAEPDSHALTSFDIEGVGTVYVSVESQMLYDPEYGRYFDLDTDGITLAIDPDAGYTEETVWDENGFATGVFKCPSCNKWFSVFLYSAEHDTRINNSEN